MGQITHFINLINCILTLEGAITLLFLGFVAKGLIGRKREFMRLGIPGTVEILLIVGVFVYSLINGKNWIAAVIQQFYANGLPPDILDCIYILFAGSGTIAVLVFIVEIVAPHKNKYITEGPGILFLGVLSGISNIYAIGLINFALGGKNPKTLSLLLIFFMNLTVYVFCALTFQARLIRLSNGLVYDLRMKLVDRILRSTYQKFAEFESGRIFSTLNDDTWVLGDAANLVARFFVSCISLFAGIVYLFVIYWQVALITLITGFILASVFVIVNRVLEKYFQRARDTQTKFMSLAQGLIYGFNEIALHRGKKTAYNEEFNQVCSRYRNLMDNANVKLVRLNIGGEFMIFSVLGLICIGIPLLKTGGVEGNLMQLVVVLLYLIGPLVIVINIIPHVTRIKVAAGRIKSFIEDLPPIISSKDMNVPISVKSKVETFTAENLSFRYVNGSDGESGEVFSVGPMDLCFKQSEITFIIGGNGSGKTTVAKLITGLYTPESGTLKINGAEVKGQALGEHFSTIFSDFHVFSRLYTIDISKKLEEAKIYLKLLELDKKVTIENGCFSSTNLSGGQKKRLGLLKCFLEDSPIFLFDEVAADQAPQFRKFFYRILLPKMKVDGKIVIAITHDDHYFDVADKIIKLDMGRIDSMHTVGNFPDSGRK
jgi:putative pyoverdin transport system ATP-binding/permease protein